MTTGLLRASILFPVRLACTDCDRGDCDGISEQELASLPPGWRDVQPEPPSDCVLDWWTHLGVCPDCAREEALPCVSRR